MPETPDIRNLSTRDPWFGFILSQVIENIRNAGGLLANQVLLRGPEGIQVPAILIPGTFDCPSYFLANLAGTNLVAVDGAAMPSQINGLMNGYDPDIFASFNYESNRYTYAASQIIFATMTAEGFNPTRPTIFAGWSLGGAIVQNMAYLNRINPNTPLQKVATFGAPQVGPDSFLNQMNGVDHIRYMTDTDWVPLIPSHICNNLSWFPFLPLRKITSFQKFGLVTGGCVLSPTGVTSASSIPPNAEIPSFSSLVGHWLNYDLPTTDHAIQVYRNRLALYIAAHPAQSQSYSADTGVGGVGGGGDVDTAPAESPTPMNHRQMTQNETRSNQALREQGAAQDVPQVVIPSAREFSAQRSGKSWYVTFNGQFVAAAPTKKRARGMAREGNALLRRMQRQAVVDPQAFVQQMTDYLAAAQDTANGFFPAMATDFPDLPPKA